MHINVYEHHTLAITFYQTTITKNKQIMNETQLTILSDPLHCLTRHLTQYNV